MAAAMDCAQQVPVNCPPKDKYRHIVQTNNISMTVPSCPSNFFPFILQMHQFMIGKYMHHYNTDSLLAWHGLGSGKTITSIMAALKPNNNVYVFCPAALIPNYEGELREYSSILLKFQNYSHPADAIVTANKFIEKANDPAIKPYLVEGETRPLVLRILDAVGNGTVTKDRVVQQITSAPDYGRLITIDLKPPPKPPGPGGTRGGAITKATVTNPVTHEITNFTFISSDGILMNALKYKDFCDFTNQSFQKSPPANLPNRIGIIDESQKTVSAALKHLKENQISVTKVKRDIENAIRQHGDHYIDQDEFESFDSYAPLSSGGYAKTVQDNIYEGFCKATSGNRAQLLLLSGTPISKHPAEIALAVNMLSGDNRKMCYNKEVFLHNFRIDNPNPMRYQYIFTNAERDDHMEYLKRLVLRNHQRFIDLCNPYISYFKNVDNMMPTINEIPGAKYVYDNNKKVCANIVECFMTAEQLAWLKYLEFIQSIHPGSSQVTSYIKTRFFDYTFKLNPYDAATRPEEVPNSKFKKGVTNPSDPMYDLTDKGFSTHRGALQTIFLGVYAKDFQTILNDLAAPGAPGAAPGGGRRTRKKYKGRRTKKMKGGVSYPDFTINSKLEKLKVRINGGDDPVDPGAPPGTAPVRFTDNKDKRHVIYSNSRISSVMISRMLHQLGYRELKNVDDPKTPTKKYAFLTSEGTDDKSDESMFKFQQDEALSLDKQKIIDYYNNNDPAFSDLKILIIGNAVAEGITLKRTDFMHIYSFPYNMSKMQQLLARANRNCVFPEDHLGRRGFITPYLYLSIIDQPEAAINAAASTIFPLVPEWVAYNTRVRSLVTVDDERKSLEDAIIINDSFLPHLFAIKGAAFDN